jgi:hypothetical protein
MVLSKRSGSFCIALASVLSLVGCVSVNQQQAAVTPAVAVARPVPVAVPVAAHAPPVVQKTAASGMPVILDTANSVDPSCHSNGQTTARVTQQPVHGAVRVLQQDVYPNFPPGNPRSSCNTIKSPGIAAEYTSAQGFVGTDFVAVEMIFPDGKDIPLRFAITVK